MEIEGRSLSALPWDAEANLGRDGVEGGFGAVVGHVVPMLRAVARSAWGGRRECLLLALVAEEPTVGLNMLVIYATPFETLGFYENGRSQTAPCPSGAQGDESRIRRLIRERRPTLVASVKTCDEYRRSLRIDSTCLKR